jgi:hypothetical protein
VLGVRRANDYAFEQVGQFVPERFLRIARQRHQVGQCGVEAVTLPGGCELHQAGGVAAGIDPEWEAVDAGLTPSGFQRLAYNKQLGGNQAAAVRIDRWDVLEGSAVRTCSGR